ncbi:MAG: exo-beta-N-acetylmuramidase NamZ domain-containing protein, partial [Woeseia sp.]
MTARLLFAALLSLAVAANTFAGEVLPGVDVLLRDNFRPLAGARVGLITNHTGLSRDGHSTIRLLHDEPSVNLVRIFSPEHGVDGKLDIPLVGDGTEGSTGIPVASLYGEVRRPTAAMLADLDTLVFDIQDIGTRFYTYIST